MDRDPGVVAEALEGLTPPLPAGALEAMAALAQAALPEVRPALVRALGRLPEPRAREVLAALARGAEPAGTAALAAMLPAPGAPADEVRDALVRYVELFEYHEGRRQMEQADSCRRMLERLTGRTFGTAAEARRWWETQGEEFLRARRP
jgi:HEAT repeat protein